ncbi:MAG: nucleotidyltransferase domain-containing protein [Candidatus Eisenbacteria bacterium]|nr:nucleotidyltransferase domain-containing protein [Candidatus Eisenbacteria bacterium]
MSLLGELVGSKIRAEVFRLLFAGPETEIHVREIERRTGFNDRAIREELRKLARLDLLIARRDGNRLYYSANRSHPLFPEIRSLALKTAGLADHLREALSGEEIRVAFVFGSVAKGEEKGGSDVDLLVVGKAGLRKIAGALRGATEAIGREVNPVVMTPEEFRRRRKEKDHFLAGVLRGPKVFVLGNEDDLRGLAP